MFKVGDLVTAYHAGLHRITDIQKRGKSYVGDVMIGGDLLFYRKEYDKNYKKVNGPSNCCDETYCRKIDAEFIAKERSRFDQIIERLNNITES